jgi:Ca2+-binding EF-hand superfamily protein
MTTITGASPSLTQHLYQRLFDRLNTDGDDALSIAEVGVAEAGNVDSAKVFNALDADGDGRVMRAEMIPSDAFAAETLNALIGTQTETSEPATNEEILADLFARADLDGDGALSAEEMKAEGDLRRAANLDAGYAAGPVFMARDADGDGLLRADEIGVTRLAAISSLPLDSIRFHDEMPEDIQRRIAEIRELIGLPPSPVLTAEEKQQQRDQWAADRAERASGPEGTMRFLARDVDGLREKALADLDAADMSQALTARLLQRITDGWTGSADVSA